MRVICMVYRGWVLPLDTGYMAIRQGHLICAKHFDVTFDVYADNDD